MADQEPERDRKRKRFEAALATRQFEIDLFWKRSLFFWGFIAASFVALATLEGKQPALSLLVSGFGMVCSLGWTLANRGSKYWQEQWESKIEDVEDEVTGPLFKREEPLQDKGWWLSGARYSVSKLAIAVSDYVLLVWVAIFVRQVWIALGISAWNDLERVAVLAISFLPVFYLVLVVGFGGSTARSKR